MAHPETHQLEAFEAVATQLHFGRAASQLNVTQSTVSHRIRALEQCVGVRLLDRTQRRVRLTEAGLVYLQRVRPLLHELARATTDAVEAASGRGGRLVIGYSGALTTTPLMDAVEALVRRLPDVAIDVQRRGLHDQLAAIGVGELDVGCSFLQLPTERLGLRSRRLAPYPVVAWVGAQHALAGADTTSLEALRDERWVVLSERAESGMGDFLTTMGAVGHRTAFEVDALDAAFDLVRRGLGVTVMPDSPVAPPGLRRLRLTDGVMATVHVIWDGARVSPPLRAFLDTIEGATDERSAGEVG